VRRKASRLRGLFVTFEGIEGCGKTTQARLLFQDLKRRGADCLLTREPGGTESTRALRKVLLTPRKEKLSGGAEVFLYLADRAQHVQEVIRPALEAGKVVLCDRYSDATLAYQGGGRGHSMRLLLEMDRLATGGIYPDLTFLLDVPVEVGLARARTRGRGQDRIESESLRFHERVRKAYLALGNEAGNRVIRIDGTQPILKVQTIIRHAISARREKQKAHCKINIGLFTLPNRHGKHQVFKDVNRRR
jgi:dTMP kinase